MLRFFLPLEQIRGSVSVERAWRVKAGKAAVTALALLLRTSLARERLYPALSCPEPCLT